MQGRSVELKKAASISIEAAFLVDGTVFSLEAGMPALRLSAELPSSMVSPSFRIPVGAKPAQK